MKQISIDDSTYYKLEQIALKLQMSVSDVLSNVVSDGVVDDYYVDDIKQAEDFEYKQNWERKHNDLYIFN